MPANLTPQYLAADRAYRQAKTPQEKIAALEEMYATIPKHKGTEKMQADIKHRLAKTRAAADQAHSKTGVDVFHVEKSGAGQVVLVGTPNSGKSALLAATTKARVNVAPYPFATHAPVPGMMPYEDIQIQLVDLPPVTSDGIVPGMTGTVRAADAALICIDLSAADALEQVETCLGQLEKRGMVPAGREAPEGGRDMPMILVGTKLDLPGAAEALGALGGLYGGALPIIGTSAETGQGLQDLAAQCFRMLGVVRVYSKEPGKPADMKQPFILQRGSTVLDFASEIHRDMAKQLKRARIWGSEKYDGQPVHRDHVIEDKDVIELHV
jgi:hypothetical protein